MTADLPLAGVIANLVAVPLGELAALPLAWRTRSSSRCRAPSADARSRRRARFARARACSRLRAAAVGRGAGAHADRGAARGDRGRCRRAHACDHAAAVTVGHSVRGRRSRLRAARARARVADAASFASRCSTSDRETPRIVDLPDGTALRDRRRRARREPGRYAVNACLRRCCARAASARACGDPLASASGSLRRPASRARRRQARARSGTPGRAKPKARAPSTRRCSPTSARAASLCAARPSSADARRSAARASTCSRRVPGSTVDRGANDNSFVVRIALGQRAVLLVGDAEHDEEGELLADRSRRAPRRRPQGRSPRQPDVDDRRRSSRPSTPRDRRHFVRRPQSLRPPGAGDARRRSRDRAARVLRTDRDGSVDRHDRRHARSRCHAARRMS